MMPIILFLKRHGLYKFLLVGAKCLWETSSHSGPGFARIAGKPALTDR